MRIHHMNKITAIISTLAIASLVNVQLAFAENEDIEKAMEKSRHKHAATVSSLTILGTLAAGPVGFIAGLLGGVYLGDSNLQDTENLHKAKSEIKNMESTLEDQEVIIVELERNLVDKLEFAVMFRTGEDSISKVEEERVRTLAEYLDKNRSLHVRLDGHADPRGTDEYNNVLSAERATNVAKTLNKYGIDYSRIMVEFHGSSYANTDSNSLDQFSLDRRVDIEIYDPTSKNDIVSTNL